MKRIIRYYITHYQPIYTGAGKSLEKLVESIDKEKFDVEILTSYKKGLKRIEFKDGYKIIRVGGKFFGEDGYLSTRGKLYFSASSAWFMLWHSRCDVLSFIGVGAISFPSILIAKFFNKKIINKTTAVGDDDPKKLSKTILGRSILKILENNTYHWVISKEIYNNCITYSNWNESSLFLITNPVEVRYKNYEVLKLEREKRKINDKLAFLFVGVLDKRKGLDILIELWIKEKIDATLILCGPRGNDIEINTILERMNQTNIHELGALDFNSIKELYLGSDYFIFPSTREGLPNVVLEAMSYGLPVLSNNIAGVTDYLLGNENERGVLINNNDMAMWTSNLNNIIEDKSEHDFPHIAQNAHKWILCNSESTVVQNKIQKMYEGIA